MSRISICNCGAPLVSTFMFSGAEFFCVECGNSLGMLDADRVEETPAMRKRADRNKKKFDSISDGLLTGGVMFVSCDTCTKTSEPHINHATPLEIAKHKAALKKVEELHK